MTNLLILAEWYRTVEQTGDVDDLQVDGIVVLRVPAQYTGERDGFEENIVNIFQPMLKDFIKAMRTDASAQRAFPKMHARIQAGTGHWFRVSSEQVLAAKPKDFHSNHFSEAELLGLQPEELDPLETLEITFNSDGDRIEGPPDKFMLSIGAA
jgi:hypothetical protein